MAKKATPINEMKFVNTLNATDKDGNKVTSFQTQPYITGMYVIIDNNPAAQICLTHKGFASFVKGTIKKMEKNGLKVEVSERLLIDYIKEDDIKKYIL